MFGIFWFVILKRIIRLNDFVYGHMYALEQSFEHVSIFFYLWCHKRCTHARHLKDFLNVLVCLFLVWYFSVWYFLFYNFKRYILLEQFRLYFYVSAWTICWTHFNFFVFGVKKMYVYPAFDGFLERSFLFFFFKCLVLLCFVLFCFLGKILIL